jgi:hypothetical protein
MASTYSNLKIELIGTGEQSGTWGSTTNTNLGTAVEEAITGRATANFSTDANLTLGYTDVNTTQVFRNLILNVTSGVSLTATRDLIVPTIEKQYLVENNTTGNQSIVVKTSAGTGITIPNGKKAHVYADGTNVVQASDLFPTIDINGGTIDGTTIGGSTAAAGTFTTATATTGNITTVNSTTVDTTNIEVTNIKAKDGTAAASIADSTGVVSITANPVLSGGTANGVLYLNGSKVATSGSALTFDGTNLGVNTAATALTNYRGAEFAGTTANTGGFLRMRSSDSSINSLDFTDVNGRAIFTTTNHPVRFGVNDVEQMRLTSTGLGIGTSSPAYKLEVVAPAGDNITALFRSGDATAANNAGGGFRSISSATAASRQAQVWLDADGANFGGGDYFYINKNGNSGTVDFVQFSNAAMRFYTNNTLQATLDSSGNLGLGVTPSAWYDPTNWKTLQINYLGMFAKQGNDSRFYSNAFLNTSGIDKYLSADYASQYKMTTGGHQWFTAPLWNGTGSDTITFTQAMTLDASGNLGVGTTSPTYRLHVANGYVGILRGIAYNASASIGIDLGASNSDSVNNSATYAWGQEVVGDASGQSLIFKSYRRNDTTVERARITSGGDLLVGTTSAIAGAKMSVVGNVNDTLVRLQNQNATAPGGLDVHYSGAATNDVNNWFYLGRDSSANRFYVQSNGGIANYQANNVNLSDRREKTNFAPAKSYLDIICAIPVQTFNYIDQNMENDGGLTLGVVAQDVQAVAPELVMESNWGTKDNPKMRLSIYQTDLQYALMKCIQEQQALIESLTTRVVQLEGA